MEENNKEIVSLREVGDAVLMSDDPNLFTDHIQVFTEVGSSQSKPYSFTYTGCGCIYKCQGGPEGEKRCQTYDL